MKLGEMQVDYSIGVNYGFFERRKLIKEGKRLLQLHPEYKILHEEKEKEWDFYSNVLIAYLKDCIVKDDPEGKELYEKEKEKDAEHFKNEFDHRTLINYFFLRKYNDLLRERANPGILEKERQERKKKEEQLELQSKIRDQLAQKELQQDLAAGTRVICPYCKSADTKKISIASRAVSVSLVGAASGKIGKQWHCNHCGSDF